MILLPTSEDPFYEQITTLDGKSYQFVFRYNQREARWYFDLRDVDLDEDIIKGVKVVPGTDLFRRIRHKENAPRGVLLAFVSEGTQSNQAPSLLELGLEKRVTLAYITPEELEE